LFWYTFVARMSHSKKGKLYLIPNTLGGPKDGASTLLMKQAVEPIRHFIVEEIKSARRWLRALGYTTDFEEVQFSMLNEHTKSHEIEPLLLPMLKGTDIALISEAGLPCVADPGSEVVRIAHEFGIHVVPMVGASSIMLALMASGMNGQSFAFTGYLPKDQAERSKRVKQLESIAISTGQTQLFMDAPYRNDNVMQTLLENLRPSTKLCIAVDLTTDHEYVVTRTVEQWREGHPNLNKRPLIFVIGK
jgi:16S rRNA (cytidine1402-2'-O)-methyltransferase